MAKKLYRGHDRDLLNKIKKCFQLIAKRDVVAGGTAKTSSISTRAPVFLSVTEDLTAAVTLVTARIDNRLAAEA